MKEKESDKKEKEDEPVVFVSFSQNTKLHGILFQKFIANYDNEFIVQHLCENFNLKYNEKDKF